MWQDLMEIIMFQRLTSVGQALLDATANEIKAGKVDHQRGTGHWVARHVAERALNNPNFGIVTEYDVRYPKYIRYLYH